MIYYLVIISIVIIDQISKYYAENYLQYMNSIPLIKEVFHLTYARNIGAAFSIFSGKKIILIGVTSVAMIYLVYYLYKSIKLKKSLMFNLSIAFIIGGGIGNLIDRIRLGYVVDFFDFTLINFAIFNIADSFIVIGCFILGYMIIFKDIEL